MLARFLRVYGAGDARTGRRAAARRVRRPLAVALAALLCAAAAYAESGLPEVTVEAVAERVIEGDDVQVTVARDAAADTSIEVTVRVSQAGGYLSAGVGERVLTIASGMRSTSLRLATVDDRTEESQGSVTVALVSMPQYELGDPATATIVVDDNDGRSTVTVAVTNAAERYVYFDRQSRRHSVPAIGEGVAPVYKFTRRGGPIDEPHTIPFRYLRRPDALLDTLGIPSGFTEASVTIPAGHESASYTLQDQRLIDDDVFVFGGQSHSLVDTTFGIAFSPYELRVWVVENERVQVSVEADDEEVSEASGTAIFRFRLHLPTSAARSRMGVRLRLPWLTRAISSAPTYPTKS